MHVPVPNDPLVNMLFEEYQARQTEELQLLLAGSLRDADLDKTDLDPELLLVQDTILSMTVGLALGIE